MGSVAIKSTSKKASKWFIDQMVERYGHIFPDDKKALLTGKVAVFEDAHSEDFYAECAMNAFAECPFDGLVDMTPPSPKPHRTSGRRVKGHTGKSRVRSLLFDLHKQGFIAIEAAGSSLSEGMDLVREYLKKDKKAKGFVFYHQQDMEAARAGRGLWLAWGGVTGHPSDDVKAGKAIAETIHKHGLSLQWNGRTTERMLLSPLVW